MYSDCFSKLEIDAIGEILNISLGASATAVSTMLNSRVDITTPVVNVVRKEEFEMDRVEPAVCVEITYVEGLEGENVMLLKRHDIKVIVEMVMGMEIPDEDFELDEINISAVCEVMNQMMGASATALSEFLGRMVNISTPISFEVENEQQFIEKYFDDNEPKVVVGFTLKIADKLESEFFNVMPIRLAKGLVEGFLPPEAIVAYDPKASSGSSAASNAGEPAPAAPETSFLQEDSKPESSNQMMSQEEIERMLAEMSSGGPAEPEPAPAPAPAPTPAPAPAAAPTPAPAAAAPTPAPAAPTPAAAAPAAAAVPAPAAGQAVPMMQAGVSPEVSMMQMQMMQQMMQQMQQMQQQMQEQKKAPAEPKMIHVQAPAQTSLKADNGIVLEGEQEENMELIMGVPLEISVEIGRTKKLVKDILDFTKGSLVVLDKLAGEQVDLFVNGQCIAKGDVVVVEDNFGIRITEIMKVNLIALGQH
jgi:flagellar motor switch protein FliN/FliY